MASQGPLYAGTVVDDATVGTLAWSNPSNAQGPPDGLFASHGFLGIGAYTDNSVKIVKGGTIGGTDQSAGATVPGSLTWTPFPATGATTNLWGLTWAASDINASNFGYAYSAAHKGIQLTHYLKSTNYGFSVSTGSTINGILAEIDYQHSSFIAGTMIRTQYGLIPIEKIQVGDLVWSFNKNKELKLCKVISLKNRLSKTLTINEVTTTRKHPFFTPQGFIEAQKLKIGDVVYRGINFREEIITKIEKGNILVPVYNFEVEESHSYFANDYAVHNITTGTEIDVDSMRMTVYFTPPPGGNQYLPMGFCG